MPWFWYSGKTHRMQFHIFAMRNYHDKADIGFSALNDTGAGQIELSFELHAFSRFIPNSKRGHDHSTSGAQKHVHQEWKVLRLRRARSNSTEVWIGYGYLYVELTTLAHSCGRRESQPTKRITDARRSAVAAFCYAARYTFSFLMTSSYFPVTRPTDAWKRKPE